MQATLNFCDFSRKMALQTISVYVEGFSRLLPTFDRSDEEADAAAKQAWKSAMSSTALDEVSDPSAYAEAAQEFGMQVYENLQFSRQQLLGLAAAGLYHLWERLLKQFFCKELRDWTFDGRAIDKIVAPANFVNLEELLTQFGFHLSQQPYYAVLSELRLVANVIKHGDGKSCEDLKTTAPQLFEGYNYHFNIFSEADKLELSTLDFTRYAKAVADFWDTLPSTMTLKDIG